MSKGKDNELLASGRALTPWGAKKALFAKHLELYAQGETSTSGGIARDHLPRLLRERHLKPYSWKVYRNSKLQRFHERNLLMRPDLADPKNLANQLTAVRQGKNTTIFQGNQSAFQMGKDAFKA